MVYEITLPRQLSQHPSEREISAAKLLSAHFKCSVTFIAPIQGYRQRTPDIIMLGNTWEIKSPTGSSKNTLEYQIRTALRQSPNVIIDGRFMKASDKLTLHNLQRKRTFHKRLKRLLFIRKDNTIIEISRQ